MARPRTLFALTALALVFLAVGSEGAKKQKLHTARGADRGTVAHLTRRSARSPLQVTHKASRAVPPRAARSPRPVQVFFDISIGGEAAGRCARRTLAPCRQFSR